MTGIKSLVFVCALAVMPGAVRAGSPQAGDGPESPSQMIMNFSGLEGGSYLGVFVAEVDAQRAKALKLPEERGVEITRVEPDSPAEKAGLKAGDVVLGYGGEKIEGMEQFRRLIRETPAGRHVNLSVFRNGAMLNLSAVIGTMKPHAFHFPEGSGELTVPPMEPMEVQVPDLPQILSGAKSPVLGVETESLSPQLATFFGASRGVLVRSVLPGSAADKAGIRAGDVITRADDTDIGTPGRLSMMVRAAFVNHKPLALKLVRNKQSLSLTVPLEAPEDGQGIAPRGQIVKQPSR